MRCEGACHHIEVDAQGRATVIDYKYRVKNGIENTKKGHAEQTHVQGGLYLMAAQKLGFEPAGMVYCGVKREVTFGGWLLSPYSDELGEKGCSADDLRQMVNDAHTVTVQATQDILDGRILPQPADEKKMRAMCVHQYLPR